MLCINRAEKLRVQRNQPGSGIGAVCEADALDRALTAAGISLHPVPGLPAFLGKRMRGPAPVRLVQPATDAEALARSLIEVGSSVVMTIAPDGLPSLAFRFATLPPSPNASSIAATIRSRFLREVGFRRDLFGWLLVEGAVFQRYAERQPRPALEAL